MVNKKPVIGKRPFNFFVDGQVYDNNGHENDNAVLLAFIVSGNVSGNSNPEDNPIVRYKVREVVNGRRTRITKTAGKEVFRYSKMENIHPATQLMAEILAVNKLLEEVDKINNSNYFNVENNPDENRIFVYSDCIFTSKLLMGEGVHLRRLRGKTEKIREKELELLGDLRENIIETRKKYEIVGELIIGKDGNPANCLCGKGVIYNNRNGSIDSNLSRYLNSNL